MRLVPLSKGKTVSKFTEPSTSISIQWLQSLWHRSNYLDNASVYYHEKVKECGTFNLHSIQPAPKQPFSAAKSFLKDNEVVISTSQDIEDILLTAFGKAKYQIILGGIRIQVISEISPALVSQSGGIQKIKGKMWLQLIKDNHIKETVGFIEWCSTALPLFSQNPVISMVNNRFTIVQISNVS